MYRNQADPAELLALFTWDNIVRARLYSKSDDFLDSLRRGSAIGPPELWLLEEAEGETGPSQS